MSSMMLTSSDSDVSEPASDGESDEKKDDKSPQHGSTSYKKALTSAPHGNKFANRNKNSGKKHKDECKL